MAGESLKDDVITVVYDDGEEEDFSVLDVVELDGKTYAVLVSDSAIDEEDLGGEDDEILLEERIFRVEKDPDGEEVLVDLDDDEYDRVVKALDEMWARECEAIEDQE
ncbi:MAG TPA: DUF1292 domain-containing protein [Firmicutes bacterium]|nr:DUF1292 domain-containing protein [Bacillota bacterium]